jgi:hypothetical protein
VGRWNQWHWGRWINVRAVAGADSWQECQSSEIRPNRSAWGWGGTGVVLVGLHQCLRREIEWRGCVVVWRGRGGGRGGQWQEGAVAVLGDQAEPGMGRGWGEGGARVGRWGKQWGGLDGGMGGRGQKSIGTWHGRSPQVLIRGLHWPGTAGDPSKPWLALGVGGSPSVRIV